MPKDLGLKSSVTPARGRPGERGPGVEELPSPTGRELEILKVLWEAGPSSVREVHQRLVPEPGDGEAVAPNTVQTLLRIMETKGLVTHTVDGRTFIYQAEFTRQESASRFLDRVFDGAASALVQTLLSGERIGDDELDRLGRLIAEARAKRTRDPEATP